MDYKAESPASLPTFMHKFIQSSATQAWRGLLLWLATTAMAHAAAVSVCPPDPAAASDERNEMYGADGRPVRLTVTDTAPTNPQCDNVTLPVAVASIRWFSLTELTRNTAPPTLTLQGLFLDNNIAVSEVIGAPVNQPDSESLPPVKPPVPSSANATVRRRSTWLWEPAWWQSKPAQAWQLAERENLDKLYISVPLGNDGLVEAPAQLAAFIKEAQARHIDVWVVVGDRHDVLPDSLPPLLRRVQAYLNYNASQPAEARLHGVQLDIEPYLLPGYVLAPDHWRDRYVATVTAVHETLAQRMPLDVVIPVWWGTHPAWGSRLLSGLQLPGLSITVMNYRTNSEALKVGALPFLAWGQLGNNKVTMALETGTVGVNAGNGRSETRRRYAADERGGELWLFDMAGTGVLVLLDGNQQGMPGKAWRHTGDSVFEVGNVTFAGKRETLRDLLAPLQAEWSVWQSFDGLAIHGLDQAGSR